MTRRYNAQLRANTLRPAFGGGAATISCVKEEPTPAASPETNAQIGLVVDASAIDEEYRGQLEVVTHRQLEPALEDAGYEIAAGVVEIAVRVRFSPIEGGKFRAHGMHFDFTTGDQVEPATQSTEADERRPIHGAADLRPPRDPK